MKDFPLPVRMVGSGSQPGEDEELQYLEMPRGMNTFRMPVVPERADVASLAGARGQNGFGGGAHHRAGKIIGRER